MKIWVTNYALSHGVFVVEDAELLTSKTSRWVRNGHAFYAHAGDWCETEEAALADADQRRIRKIASLKKQIVKLEALTFKVSS